MDLPIRPKPKGGTRLRFPKSIRLCSRIEIDRVFREGRYRKLGILQSKVLATERPDSRFLISVRKKIGTAPARNRIKRLVREAIRLNREGLQGAWDVCFFLTGAPPKNLRLATLEAEIRRLFCRLNQSPPTGSRR